MNIFCVGMNYAQHNKELGCTLFSQEAPVIFTKPESALLKNGKPFFIPDDMGRIDYEAELVVRISRLGKCVPQRFAHRYYDAFTVGVDFTARELQQRLRSLGLPWTLSKGFDGSAVIGQWTALSELPSAGSIGFRLDVNGSKVQQGNSADMFFSVDAIIAYVSRFFILRTGDLIFTGSPVGVGAVSIDDHLEGFLGEKKVLDFYCK